jgi:hypothetical protein
VRRHPLPEVHRPRRVVARLRHQDELLRGALTVADGTSCRRQIEGGAQRGAVHVARVLMAALG